MFRFSAFVLFLFASFLPLSGVASLFNWSNLSEKAQRAQYSLDGFDEIVEASLRDYNVPGIAIGVVVDGHVILAQGYGLRNIEKQQPVTSSTVFPMGSATKAFCTFLMGMLIDEGFLYWDQPVVDILPDFRLWDQYATQNLTLRDLITHRTGMPRHDFMWYNSGMTRDEVFAKLRHLEPTCDIRERYNYGNLMYMVAGMAMERVSGKSWEDLVMQKIVKPLGMNATNFSLDALKQSSEAAIGYVERDGTIRKMKYRDVSQVGPAAALNSTITDMTHWLQMLLAQGVYNHIPLISPTTFQEMKVPQVIVSGYPENKEALMHAYGFGWGIVPYRGHYFVSHDGGLDGFTSVVGFLPHDDVGIVIVANKNLSSLPRYLALEVMDRVLGLTERKWLQEGLEQIHKSRESAQKDEEQENLSKKKNTAPSHALRDYAGVYSHPGYGELLVELEEGHLQATLHGITSTLEHWHYDVFSVMRESEDMLISRVGTKYTFRNNVNGDIEELIVPYEAGASDIVFKKHPDEQFSNLEYFRQFTGPYEIYNVVVEVAIRDRQLIAIIPGQPDYQLVSVSENEFSVKSMSHYSVRFVKGPDGQVYEALLVLPYGAFTATKILP